MFYEKRFRGWVGVTGGSIGYDANVQTVRTFSLNLPVGDAFKAYLLAGRAGPANPLTVTLNGQSITFNNSNRVSSIFTSNYGGPSGVHAVDITSLPIFTQNSTNNFTLTIPAQNPTVLARKIFTDFVLFVAWKNDSYPIINTCIYLNDLNMATGIGSGTIPSPGYVQWNISTQIPINTGWPVALGLFTGYICECANGGDGANVRINVTNVGRIGNSCASSNTPCAGQLGSYTYGNSTFTALQCSTINSLVGCTDVLSNINPYIANNATLVPVRFTPESATNGTNHYWGAFLTYRDPGVAYECDACATLTASNITTTTADLSWSGCTPGVRNDNIQYRAYGSPTWISVNVGAASAYNVVGLTPDTLYEWQVVNVTTGSPPTQCAPSSIETFLTVPI